MRRTLVISLAGIADTRDCFRERLDRDRHMKGIGVNERRPVAHDGDMAFPEDEVAAPQNPLPGWRTGAPSAASCMSLSRGQNGPRRSARPGRGPSNRDRARSCRPTDTARQESAPPRRRNQARGNRAAQDAAPAHRRPSASRPNAPSTRAIASRAPSGSASSGGSLIDGTRESERAQRCHFMSRWRAGGRQRIRREPADITVGGELAPGPAFGIHIVDRDALALERFGQKRRVRRRRRAHRRLRLDHLVGTALDKARCRDLAFQIPWPRDRRGRASGEDRSRASRAISRSARRATRRSRAPPGSRRLPAGRAGCAGSRQTRRNAPTISR